MWLYLWILAEIVVFILVGSWIGIGWTLLAIVVTTLLGFALLRNEGLRTMQKMNETMRQGSSLPKFMAINSSMVMISGMLLILPGFITDALGVLLLIPGVRSVIIKRFQKAGMNIQARARSSQSAQQKEDQTIEGECWSGEDQSKKHKKD